MDNEPQDAYLPEADGETIQPFDVREQSGNSGMLKLAGAFVFLLILAFVIMKLFASGTRDRDQPPRIVADNAPYKEVPLNRGGAQTPNQDKEIYQVLNGTTTETKVKTVPVAEEPLPKPKAQSKPVANVVIKEPESTKPTTPTSKPEIHTLPKQVSGKYVVQVASLRSKSEAEAMWDKLSGKSGTLLSASHFADIKRVDLGARGIYYRLRISGLADKSAATQLCQKLKANKQDCIVTLR